MAPTDTLTCTATYAATQADIDAGSIVNLGSVTGSNATVVTDDDDAIVSATPTPGIAIVKTADPSTVNAAGVW